MDSCLKNMETITSPTCLWALVVLVGIGQVWELFSLMCFRFWLEISGEKR